MIVYQLESDLKDEERSKFFYFRVNGNLIQSSIPNRQKQGSLRKYRSCYNVNGTVVNCRAGAKDCRFYHDPMLDKESTDVRNYPELSRYIPRSTFEKYGDGHSPSAYSDSIGDVDSLEKDLDYISGHDIYVFGQKTLGHLLCLMAATKRKPVSLTPE